MRSASCGLFGSRWRSGSPAAARDGRGDHASDYTDHRNDRDHDHGNPLGTQGLPTPPSR